jgi:hypothetical protein
MENTAVSAENAQVWRALNPNPDNLQKHHLAHQLPTGFQPSVF